MKHPPGNSRIVDRPKYGETKEPEVGIKNRSCLCVIYTENTNSLSLISMADTNSGNGGTNIVAIVALIILAGLAVLFFVYGLPMLQEAASPEVPSEIRVEIPTPQPTPEE